MKKRLESVIKPTRVSMKYFHGILDIFMDIFNVSLPSGIESVLFEILCTINDKNKAQFRITKLLIASDMETLGEFPAALHKIVCYKVF